ncbi:hypothetical protein LTR93_010724 [Exophiala xenobiotica]|nr:hypothetical protein LTR93_010724 [Exophiala xenobiotica]
MTAERLSATHSVAIPENVSPRFVGLDSPSKRRAPTGQHTCQGLYWTRDGEKPSIAFLATHYSADFSEHYFAGELANRGYGFLGWNTRFRGLEDMFILENALEDIGVGCQWLKDVAKVAKIILIGNSGGGSLMGAYQAKAQEDSSLIAADGLIFVNSHLGRPNVLTSWLDPSVTDEADPVKTDPSLDMYNAANMSPYSQDFCKRYRAAQIERNHRITDWAKQELVRLHDAGVPDLIFPLHRTMADLRFNDPTIDPSDRPVPRCYLGDPAKANRSIGLVGRTSTLRTWLSMWSLKESKSKFELYGAKLKIPAAVIQGTADVGVFPSDARSIFESLVSEHKELHMIPGGHFFDENQEIFDGAVKVITDFVRKWFGN